MYRNTIRWLNFVMKWNFFHWTIAQKKQQQSFCIPQRTVQKLQIIIYETNLEQQLHWLYKYE